MMTGMAVIWNNDIIWTNFTDLTWTGEARYEKVPNVCLHRLEVQELQLQLCWRFNRDSKCGRSTGWGSPREHEGLPLTLETGCLHAVLAGVLLPSPNSLHPSRLQQTTASKRMLMGKLGSCNFYVHRGTCLIIFIWTSLFLLVPKS